MREAQKTQQQIMTPAPKNNHQMFCEDEHPAQTAGTMPSGSEVFGPKLKTIAKTVLALGTPDNTHKSGSTASNGTSVSNVELYAVAGSILDFESKEHGCVVNAANTGGVTGFGVDERINRAAGDFEIKQARKALGGVPTGTAKSTPAFRHSRKVPYIIHACGPVLRANSLSRDVDQQTKFEQVSSAYRAALEEACRLGCRDIAFCLISAGVFRGEEIPLSIVIRLGLGGIAGFYRNRDRYKFPVAPTRVVLVGYTKDEQDALVQEFSKLS